MSGVDPDKVRFLFGAVPEGFDVSDPDDRAELVALDAEERLAGPRSAMRAIVAEQIVGGDPPNVWATAQRLVDGSELEVFSADAGDRAWHGPEGWLGRFDVGALVAFRVGPDGVVALDAAGEPTLDPELVALVRAVYDEEVAEPWLPVRGEDLVVGALARDRDAFSTPRPALDDLCAAGLERRGEATT